jgi:hypothetical protein
MQTPDMQRRAMQRADIPWLATSVAVMLPDTGAATRHGAIYNGPIYDSCPGYGPGYGYGYGGCPGYGGVVGGLIGGVLGGYRPF